MRRSRQREVRLSRGSAAGIPLLTQGTLSKGGSYRSLLRHSREGRGSGASAAVRAVISKNVFPSALKRSDPSPLSPVLPVSTVAAKQGRGRSRRAGSRAREHHAWMEPFS